MTWKEAASTATSRLCVLALAALATVSCGSTPPAQSAPAVTVFATVTATPPPAPAQAAPAAPAAPDAAEAHAPAAPAAPAAPEAPEAPAKADKVKVIPNVVGMNHQRAQDRLQAAGFYRLREVDATGQKRLMVWDRNWVVQSQSPKAGSRASSETVITLYSKKKTDP
ncbi:PASTA domain-containing protein [Sinosporangium album]|uniref:PASTA domain-containing protein n=2 Tax=Sinosporangium album TaxID=504805 RepID=A0A1G8ITF7_9ACTN|nr:PASTA domain-containing protein [Sinosporangium album]